MKSSVSPLAIITVVAIAYIKKRFSCDPTQSLFRLPLPFAFHSGKNGIAGKGSRHKVIGVWAGAGVAPPDISAIPVGGILGN